jgi:hypothetical protein
MKVQKSATFANPPCVRRNASHGPRSRRQRVVTSFAITSQQLPQLDEVLKTSAAIGSAAFGVLIDEAVDVAAEASRIQAEQFRILERLPEDPQGTINSLIQDIQRRQVPSVSDVMQRASSVMVCLEIAATLTAHFTSHLFLTS